MPPSSPLVVSVLLWFVLHSSASNYLHQRSTFVVQVRQDAKPSVFPTHQNWYDSTLTSLSSSRISENAVADASSALRLIHTYNTAFHGFSAKLSSSEAAKLETVGGVLSVISEQVRSLHTTRSPEFLGLNTTDGRGLLRESGFGSSLVIGVLDTGIWPERESFNDRDLPPVPSKWKGECEEGKGFQNTTCNKKLVGARYFCAGYEASNGAMNESAEYRSPLDSDGHGTHTASIAAGRYVFPASVLGYAHGQAAGMAPKARLAVYKVCWIGGCYDSDILAGFDAAVKDGVDVISLSVGGLVVPYHLDAIAIAAFRASEAGIFVSASGGNGGPNSLSVTNVPPWVTTVGAGSIDRDFPAEIHLGNGDVIYGVGLYDRFNLEEAYELIYAGDLGFSGFSSSVCSEGSLNPDLVKGKIVLCDRGVTSRTSKGEAVREVGGVGMILANAASDGEGLVAEYHVLPAVAVGAAAGDRIRSYITSAGKSSNGKMVFKGTKLGIRPAPMVASFSARGPNPETPDILKPDIIAPGLNILAAWPDSVGPAGIVADQRRTEFNLLSGTSMACPHVSGVAALLKGANPQWSPAAIRSAMMTTALTIDDMNQTMLDDSTGNASSYLDFGAGYIQPEKAMDPGLVYDLDSYDYVDFLCNSNYTAKDIETVTRKTTPFCAMAPIARHVGNLNYPSISATFQQYGSQKMFTHLIRRVTNVGDPNSEYSVTVRPPEGVEVTVEPPRLAFRRLNQKLNFLVRLEVEARRLTPGNFIRNVGSIVWTDGIHVVTSPLIVTLQQPVPN